MSNTKKQAEALEAIAYEAEKTAKRAEEDAKALLTLALQTTEGVMPATIAQEIARQTRDRSGIAQTKKAKKAKKAVANDKNNSQAIAASFKTSDEFIQLTTANDKVAYRLLELPINIEKIAALFKTSDEFTQLTKANHGIAFKLLSINRKEIKGLFSTKDSIEELRKINDELATAIDDPTYLDRKNQAKKKAVLDQYFQQRLGGQSAIVQLKELARVQAEELTRAQEEQRARVQAKELVARSLAEQLAHAESRKEKSLGLENKINTDQIKSSQTEAEETHSSSQTNISMMVLGGFIAAVGIASVAIAFTLLNAATFGIPGIIVAGVGVATTLSGVGIFATGAYKNSNSMAFIPPPQPDMSLNTAI